MSKRTSIMKALAEKLKLINGEEPYKSNIYNNSFPKLKFWDECNDFPSIYMSPGTETREYHPSGFAWVFFPISLKIYTKGDDAAEQLETLLEDIERVIDANRVLQYDEAPGHETTEILILSITTDEGLLAPYGVGELVLQIRYQKM